MATKYDLPPKLRRMLWLVETFRPLSEKTTLKQLQRLRKPFPIDLLANWVLGKPIPLHEVTDRTIPMRDGVEIPIRIYRPNEKAGLPIILNFHGGGWALGNLQQSDPYCRKIAVGVEAVVISVDYRLAPENPFPTPVNDAYDSLVWAYENADSLKADREKLAVTGDSAGGNLSAAICLMARDLGHPKIAFQGLIYPATNGKMDYPSIDLHAHAPILTKAAMEHYLDLHRANPDDHLHPYFSPRFAEHHRDLPPSFILTAGYDPLRDDGREYAKQLEAAGNEVLYAEYEKEIHGFMTFANHSPRNAEGVALMVKEMRRRLKGVS